MTWPLVTVMAVGAAGAVALASSRPATARVAKLAASTAMIAVAFTDGVPAPTWARLVVAGLVLSWIGDLALTYRGTPAFLAGLGAFLAAHLVYVAAFTQRGTSTSGLIIGLVIVAAAAVIVGPWLLRPVEQPLRGPSSATSSPSHSWWQPPTAPIGSPPTGASRPAQLRSTPPISPSRSTAS